LDPPAAEEAPSVEICRDLPRSAEEAPSVESVPSETLRSLLNVTGPLLDPSALSRAMTVAVAKVRQMEMHRMPPTSRRQQVRACLEAVVVEALHWNRLQQAIEASGSEMTDDCSPTLASAHTPPPHKQGLLHLSSSHLVEQWDDTGGHESDQGPVRASPTVTSDATAAALARLGMPGPIVLLLVGALGKLAADGGGDEAGDEAVIQLMSDHVGARAVVHRAVAEIEEVHLRERKAAMAMAEAELLTKRDAERAQEKGQFDRMLAEMAETGERAKTTAAEESARHVRGLRERETQAAVDSAVRQAVQQTRDYCEKLMKAELGRVQVESFEKGKSSVSKKADQAMFKAAQQHALENARKEVDKELRAAVEAEAAARELLEQARAEAKAGQARSVAEAKQAVAMAVPIQRQAAEALVEEAVTAERGRCQAIALVERERAMEQLRTELTRGHEVAIAQVHERSELDAHNRSQAVLAAAKDQVRLEERLAQRTLARQELKEALDAARQVAAQEKVEAIREALAAEERRRAGTVNKGAVMAVIDKSKDHARSVEALAAAQLCRHLEQAELRHRVSQKQAVHEAVQEAIARRRQAEEHTVHAAVSAACEANSVRHRAELEAALAASEAKMAQEAARARDAQAAAIRKEAEAEALDRIKPQLLKQEAVEQAIRDAEERARERERQLSVQVQARIEEMATEAAEQPKAVKESIKRALRENEERAEARLKSVHEAYEKAASEMQAQNKELMRDAAIRSRQQQQAAVESERLAGMSRMEEERRKTLEQARTAVQLSAVQTAEQIDGVLAELAEVRAENMRLATELDAKSDQLARMTEMLVGDSPFTPDASAFTPDASAGPSPPKAPAPPQHYVESSLHHRAASSKEMEGEGADEEVTRGDRGDHGDRGDRGDHGDRGDREEDRNANTWAAAKPTSDPMEDDPLALLRGVGLDPEGIQSPGNLEVQTAIGVSLDDVPANQPEVSKCASR